MVNKTKKAVKQTLSPVAQKLNDDISKSNAKRGIVAADLSTLKVVKRSKGSKYNPNDVLVITNDGAVFYNEGKLPPQLHFLFDIVIELGSNASIGKVFDIWNERHYVTKQYTQDAVTIYNGHYKGYCEGNVAHKGKRRELAISLTGSSTCQLLMIA